MVKKGMGKDGIAGYFLLGVGLFVIFYSSRMAIWKNSVPHEGFMPFVLGMLMCLLSLGFLATGAGKKGSQENREDLPRPAENKNILQVVKSRVIEDPEEAPADGKIDRRRLYQYLVTVLLYVLAFERFGYLLTTGLFFMAVLKFIEKKGYLYSLLTTLAVVLISFFLFGRLLQVPFPAGILGF